MYLNSFPRASGNGCRLHIGERAYYEAQDLEGFVKSYIDGCTSSLYIAEDGDLASHIAALEDSERKGDALEEVLVELLGYREQRDLTITLSSRRDYLGEWAEDKDYAEFQEKALAKLTACWPYATVQLGESHRLVTADHDSSSIKEYVEACAVQMLEKLW